MLVCYLASFKLMFDVLSMNKDEIFVRYIKVYQDTTTISYRLAPEQNMTMRVDKDETKHSFTLTDDHGIVRVDVNIKKDPTRSTKLKFTFTLAFENLFVEGVKSYDHNLDVQYKHRDERWTGNSYRDYKIIESRILDLLESLDEDRQNAVIAKHIKRSTKPPKMPISDDNITYKG